MTLFDKLSAELPVSVLPISAKPMTASEVRNALLFESKIATEFILFLLSVFLAVAASGTSVAIQIVAAASYVLWLALLRPKPVPLLLTLTACGCFIGTRLIHRHIFRDYPNLVHEIFAAIFALQAIFRLGYHPTTALIVRVPFSAPVVWTGLVIVAAIAGISASIEQGLLQTILGLLALVFAAITIAFMAKTAVEFRQIFKHKIYAPWTDTFLAIQAVVEFRFATGLKISHFARIIDSHSDDDLEPVTFHILSDWLGETRAASVWQYLGPWKQTRLGLPFDPVSDAVPTDVLKRIAQTLVDPGNTPPLRSPLLRGH